MAHKVVIGLGWGDEGKGATVDRICASEGIDTVIRFSGGPQAAHNVITPDGRHHTFQQFGSGTFAGAKTFLSRFMLVNPLNLMREFEHLFSLGEHDALRRMYIDRSALLVTPLHAAANRAREKARGGSAHGTTGQGIGETARIFEETPELALRVADLLTPGAFREKLYALDEVLGAELPMLEHPDIEALMREYMKIVNGLNIVDSDWLGDRLDHPCVFEGSQGVLLDRWHGFFPHVTRSETTAQNAYKLLDDFNYGERAHTVGVIRAYHTRHGAGPFPSEVGSESKYYKNRPEPHNTSESSMAGEFRVGYFDAVMFDYAHYATYGVDSLAVTHLDRIDPGGGSSVVTSYTTSDGLVISKIKPQFDQDLERVARLGKLLDTAIPQFEYVSDLPEWLSERYYQMPISMKAYGPNRDDVRSLLTAA